MAYSLNPDNNELDDNFAGMSELTITDETILSILEGTADELSLLDYKSLSNLSAPVVAEMHTVVMAVFGKCGKSLSKRYNELWAE